MNDWDLLFPLAVCYLLIGVFVGHYAARTIRDKSDRAEWWKVASIFGGPWWPLPIACVLIGAIAIVVMILVMWRRDTAFERRFRVLCLITLVTFQPRPQWQYDERRALLDTFKRRAAPKLE